LHAKIDEPFLPSEINLTQAAMVSIGLGHIHLGLGHIHPVTPIGRPETQHTGSMPVTSSVERAPPVRVA
jgi:hypothetical protein